MVGGVATAPVPVETQGVQPPGAGPPDLILVNGRIHTLDARNTIARTITLRDGRVRADTGAPHAPAREQVPA